MTIREIGRIGDVLDRVVAVGATDVGPVTFLVSDAWKALDQAREAAIADARRKAEVYAKAAGLQLGRVEWITEEPRAASANDDARASRAGADRDRRGHAAGQDHRRL